MKFKISYIFKNKKIENQNAELIYVKNLDNWKIHIEDKEFEQVINKRNFLDLKNFLNYCKKNKINVFDFEKEEKDYSIYIDYNNFLNEGEQDSYGSANIEVFSFLRFKINSKNSYLFLRNNGNHDFSVGDLKTMEIIDFGRKQHRRDMYSEIWDYIDEIDKTYYACSDMYSNFQKEFHQGNKEIPYEERINLIEEGIKKLNISAEKILLLFTYYFDKSLEIVREDNSIKYPKLMVFSALLGILKINKDFYEKYIVFKELDIKKMENEFGEVNEILFYKKYLLNERLNENLISNKTKDKKNKI